MDKPVEALAALKEAVEALERDWDSLDYDALQRRVAGLTDQSISIRYDLTVDWARQGFGKNDQ